MLRLAPCLILLFCCACLSSSTPAPPPTLGEDASATTVMTYNVNYGIAGDQETIDVIASSNAELVLLQETTAEWEQALRQQLITTYPHMHFEHCCGAGGLAVLSKHPFKVDGMLDPPDGGWFPAMAIRAKTSLGELSILQVHLRPPLSEDGGIVSGYFTTKEIREREIVHYLDELVAMSGDTPDLIAGDFNEDDGRAITWLERKKGFRSALPEFVSSQHTWRWQTSMGEITQRLDHIVYDPEVLSALDAHAVEAGSSDHLPVLSSFKRTHKVHAAMERAPWSANLP